MGKPPITDDIIAIIKRALAAGHLQHRIAAHFDLNQGRISEINRGKRGRDVPAADRLPPDFPALA